MKNIFQIFQRNKAKLHLLNEPWFKNPGNEQEAILIQKELDRLDAQYPYIDMIKLALDLLHEQEELQEVNGHDE